MAPDQGRQGPDSRGAPGQKILAQQIPAKVILYEGEILGCVFLELNLVQEDVVGKIVAGVQHSALFQPGEGGPRLWPNSELLPKPDWSARPAQLGNKDFEIIWLARLVLVGIE